VVSRLYMTNLFNSLQNQMERQNLVARSGSARAWLQSKVMNMGSTASLVRDGSRSDNTFQIGKMYFFAYDPLTKKTMPYYDRFPLVIPIEQYADGFLGMNLHYVPPTYRAKLLDKMMDTMSNKRFDERTKFRINYEMLNASTKFAIFKPCVKRYLYKQMRSRFIRIDANEWDTAIFLPVEKFVGASTGRVYSDSMRKM